MSTSNIKENYVYKKEDWEKMFSEIKDRTPYFDAQHAYDELMAYFDEIEKDNERMY